MKGKKYNSFVFWEQYQHDLAVILFIDGIALNPCLKYVQADVCMFWWNYLLWVTETYIALLYSLLVIFRLKTYLR